MHRIFLAFGCFTLLALASPAAATDSSPASGTPTGAGACTVTSGGNKGKTGVFTNDVDGLNCAGTWGATNCNGLDGKPNGNCKAAMTVHRPPTNTMAPAARPQGSTY